MLAEMSQIVPAMIPHPASRPARQGSSKDIGPYSGLARFSSLDLRTRYGRVLRGVRADLTAHVGGRPTAAQKMLIERAAQLSLRIAMMDDATAAGKSITSHDSKTYLAWSNSLTRALRDLGLKGAAQAPRSLREHLAAKAGA